MFSNSGAGATALKQTTSVQEVLTPALRNRIQTSSRETVKAQDSKFANIKSNPFYATMFDESLSPEQKVEAVGKTLTFEGRKEEMRERVEAFETFKEYLQNVREEMAREIIKVTDTEAMSELKKNYDQLNNALIEFDNLMKPLTDITDAVYTLRTNGVAHDAFKVIQEQRASEEALAAERDAIKVALGSLTSRINSLNSEIAVLNEDKGFFGLGGVKKESRERIALLTLDLENARTELIGLEGKANALSGRTVETSSELVDYQDQIGKLRELLDISSEEHRDRQKKLVDSALNFVSTSKERIGSARDHLGKMGTQVENLGDANGKIMMVYATLTEGIKIAEKKNQEIRESLEPPKEGEESMIAKMTREEKKRDVLGHITLLDQSSADTTVTLGDLTSQPIRIKTMGDAVKGQVAQARTMHSQGVAGVADRLSVVLQAVSAAALGESSAIAKDTLVKMSQNTNTVAQKESIRVAMGVNDVNNDIMRAIDDLAAYGEITKASTEITREGVADMRNKLEELQNIARGVQENVQEAMAVNSDVFRGISSTDSNKEQPKVSKSPFGV